MGARRRGREAALQMLCQMDVSGESAEDTIRKYWLHLSASKEGEAFANRIVRAFESERDLIDGAIRGVSHHWRLERMTVVDRNILRLGACELIQIDEIPPRVTLNESVELARRFGSEGSTGFVNGLLDRIAADQQKA